MLNRSLTHFTNFGGHQCQHVEPLRTSWSSSWCGRPRLGSLHRCHPVAHGLISHVFKSVICYWYTLIELLCHSPQITARDFGCTVDYPTSTFCFFTFCVPFTQTFPTFTHKQSSRPQVSDTHGLLLIELLWQTSYWNSNLNNHQSWTCHSCWSPAFTHRMQALVASMEFRVCRKKCSLSSVPYKTKNPSNHAGERPCIKTSHGKQRKNQTHNIIAKHTTFTTRTRNNFHLSITNRNKLKRRHN